MPQLRSADTIVERLDRRLPSPYQRDDSKTLQKAVVCSSATRYQVGDEVEGTSARLHHPGRTFSSHRCRFTTQHNMFASSSRPVCLRTQVSRVTQTQQTRNATLIRRPKRPYTFTQLITLSDGSTFLHRTTSPEPVYRTTKDTKNNALWNPSSEKLLNVEEDEAGRLARFRARFGRGWDVEAVSEVCIR